MLDGLPDGIHSGLHKSGNRGMFFYFTAPDPQGGRQHFWRYYDAETDRIVDNRFVIANLIACSPDTPRVLGEFDVFAIQERVINDILKSVEAQAAAEAAPTIIDPIQKTLETLLQGYLNNPDLNRSEARQLMAALRRPARGVLIKSLKAAYAAYTADENIGGLVATLRPLLAASSPAQPETSAQPHSITREALRLICFEHLVA